MSVCVPIRDMRNTADFSALVEREGNVTVTRNGYTAIHCLSESTYRATMEEAAKAKLLARLLLAEGEIERGEGEDFDSFAQQIRCEYGL